MERWKAASRQLAALQAAVDGARGERDAAMQMVVDRALAAIPHAAGAAIEMVEDDSLAYRAGSGIAANGAAIRLQVDQSLAGRCVRTGEAQICTDSESDPRVDQLACRRIGARSLAIAPLTFHERTVGVLKLYAAAPHAFDERDLIVAQLLANIVAVALGSAEWATLVEAHDRVARRFVATFHQAAVGLAHVAPDGRFLRVNERFCEIVGHDEAELLQGGFQQITHPDDLAEDLGKVAALLDGTTPHYSVEKRYVRRDGDAVWTTLTVSLVHNADGSPDFFVAVIEDISARKHAEALAAYDPLTGLPNRRSVLDALAARLAELPRPNGPLAVAYLDIDRFKSVNDRFGHAEGDRCLVAIAKALRESLRGADLLGRIAGDEFVLVLPGTNEVAAAKLLERLCRVVDHLPQIEAWEVGISAGAIIVPPACHAEPDMVLHAADQLMYRMKRDHASRPVVEPLAAGLLTPARREG